MDQGDDLRRGWSTRQLAEMTETTVKTIRHYHRVGVLPEPRRRSNGYKAYGPEHAIRLLQILRMREAGLPVARISAAFEEGDPALYETSDLIAVVDSSIRRLEGIRDDLVAARDAEHDTGRPIGSGTEHTDLEATMPLLMSRHFTQGARIALRSARIEPSPIDAEFARLPVDADAETIDDLARRMAPHIRRAQSEHALPDQVVDGVVALKGVRPPRSVDC